MTPVSQRTRRCVQARAVLPSLTMGEATYDVQEEWVIRIAGRAGLLWVGLLVAALLTMYGCVSNTKPNAKPLSEQFGSLPPGKYVADKFEPAFSFEVTEGWEVSELQQKVFVEISRGIAISFNNPPSKVSSPKNPDKLVPAPEKWVSWFQEHPYLKTSKPVPGSVGGVEGERFDTKVSFLPEDYYSADCLGYGVPLWPLLEGHHWCADEGLHLERSWWRQRARR